MTYAECRAAYDTIAADFRDCERFDGYQVNAFGHIKQLTRILPTNSGESIYLDELILPTATYEIKGWEMAVFLVEQGLGLEMVVTDMDEIVHQAFSDDEQKDAGAADTAMYEARKAEAANAS